KCIFGVDPRPIWNTGEAVQPLRPEVPAMEAAATNAARPGRHQTNAAERTRSEWGGLPVGTGLSGTPRRRVGRIHAAIAEGGTPA
ncbi:MAG: hypothetical protein ACOYOH_26465, partial [Paracraurococcus sp.]